MAYSSFYFFLQLFFWKYLYFESLLTIHLSHFRPQNNCLQLKVYLFIYKLP